MSEQAAPDQRGSTDASSESLPIAIVAERTGLSKDTLRYYEKAGLIRAVNRSGGGQRRYVTADLDWLAFLLRLRDTGMSIATMQRFASLRSTGEATVADRIALLEQHRADVHSRIRSLRRNLRALDSKVEHYRELREKQIQQEAS